MSIILFDEWRNSCYCVPRTEEIGSAPEVAQAVEIVALVCLHVAC